MKDRIEDGALMNLRKLNTLHFGSAFYITYNVEIMLLILIINLLLFAAQDIANLL